MTKMDIARPDMFCFGTYGSNGNFRISGKAWRNTQTACKNQYRKAYNPI